MFHLGLLTFPLQTHLSQGTWRNPLHPVRRDFDRPGLWQEAARLCEDACFDFLFAADTEGIIDGYGGDRSHALKDGVGVPALDQAVLADYLAAVTTRLGIVTTMSTTASQPWLTARRLASMDHLSSGRAGWNIVTASHAGAMRGFGINELPKGDARYDRAEEFVTLCRQLWNSWDADALQLDAGKGIFIDPAKVHDVHFQSEHFKCDAPLNVHRSPQSGPLLCQAGASPRGIQFAGRHVDLAFAIQPSVEGMRDYRDEVRAAAVNAGRDPSSCKVMFAFHAFVGETEAEAQAKFEQHKAAADVKACMVSLSGVLGIDLSMVDPKTPVGSLDVPGVRGFITAWTAGSWAAGQDMSTLTLEQVLLHQSLGVGPRVIGTPAQIADWMEETMATVGGDGFVYEPLYLPTDLEEFTRMVVPELQRRGLTRSSYSEGTLRDNLMAF